MQQFSKFYIRIIFNPKYIFHKQSQSERTCCASFSFVVTKHVACSRSLSLSIGG